MRISDWSSDVCSSDLRNELRPNIERRSSSGGRGGRASHRARHECCPPLASGASGNGRLILKRVTLLPERKHDKVSGWNGVERSGFLGKWTWATGLEASNSQDDLRQGSRPGEVGRPAC